jgi:hypothetical protein
MRFRMICWRLLRRPRPAPSPVSGPRPPAMSARPATRDPSAPAGVPPAPASADPDRRGSRRLLVAAELLRRGDDIGRVAAITRVPVALLELVRDEIGDQGTGKPAATASTGGIGDRGARPDGQDERLGEQLELGGRQLARARHRIVVLVLTEVAAAASVAACLAALVWHRPGLAALAGLAAALMFAVFLVSRILARRREPRPFTRH